MTDALNFRNIAWLSAALALVAAPQLPRLPVWISLMAALLLAWRLYLARATLPLPSRWVLVAFTLAGTVGVALSYGQLFGRNPGVALLLLLIALKLLELRTQRDAMLVIFLSYFLVLTNFLYSQTIPMALYLLAVVFFITATLVGFNLAPDAPRLGQKARLAAMLLAQAVPLMLVLFVFFPRVTGPLWGLPQDALSGASGLSDTMAPGSLAQLSLSDATAFRVNFSGPIPPPSRLYWRGPVLPRFDGRAWTLRKRFEFREPRLESAGARVEYEVTLEPHNRSWLFALEMPAARPPQSAITTDYQMFSRHPVRSRMRYSIASNLDYRVGLQERGAELEEALQLPEGFNPRARQLAEGWRGSAAGPAEIVNRALLLFRGEGFAYTLQPPLLGLHSVDEFLFETRRGFCEHYASSFVFLMRAAGVPARVVTGYLGGEVNPVGNYLIVRQADAHAWAEVWLAGRGWVRVDPTAAVAPSRVESGIAAALPATEPLALMVRADIEWLRQLRLNWDSAAFRWNQWVLGYGTERQLEFLSRLGMKTPDWRDMAAALLVGAGGLLLAVAAAMLYRLRGARRDPLQAAWLGFCAKLARRDCPRAPGEGPRDFAARVARLRPDLARPAQDIARLYIALRYGTLTDPAALRELRRRVAEFKA